MRAGMPPRTSTRCRKPPIRFVEVDSSEEGSPTKKQRLTQPSRDQHRTAESEDGSLEYETVISLNGSSVDSSTSEDEQEAPAGTELQARLHSNPSNESVQAHLADSKAAPGRSYTFSCLRRHVCIEHRFDRQ